MKLLIFGVMVWLSIASSSHAQTTASPAVSSYKWIASAVFVSGSGVCVSRGQGQRWDMEIANGRLIAITEAGGKWTVGMSKLSPDGSGTIEVKTANGRAGQFTFAAGHGVRVVTTSFDSCVWALTPR